MAGPGGGVVAAGSSDEDHRILSGQPAFRCRVEAKAFTSSGSVAGVNATARPQVVLPDGRVEVRGGCGVHRDRPVRPVAAGGPGCLDGGTPGDVLPRARDHDRQVEDLGRDGLHRGVLRGAADQQEPCCGARLAPRRASSPPDSPQSMPSMAARARLLRVLEAMLSPWKLALAWGRLGVRSPSK